MAFLQITHLDSGCDAHLDEVNIGPCAPNFEYRRTFNKSGTFLHWHYVKAILLMFTLNFVMETLLN
jgi:hypothetical protein